MRHDAMFPTGDLFDGPSDADRDLQFRHNTAAAIEFLEGKTKHLDFRPSAIGEAFGPSNQDRPARTTRRSF